MGKLIKRTITEEYLEDEEGDEDEQDEAEDDEPEEEVEDEPAPRRRTKASRK
jgi:hypothetical protein